MKLCVQKNSRCLATQGTLPEWSRTLRVLLLPVPAPRGNGSRAPRQHTPTIATYAVMQHQQGTQSTSHPHPEILRCNNFRAEECCHLPWDTTLPFLYFPC